MQNGISSPLAYKHILTVSFLLFLKSLQLYAELGERAITDPRMMRNAKIQSGLKNIIATIELCGSSLERLPASPPGAETVDPLFRDLGSEIQSFANALKQLARTENGEERKKRVLEFQDRALKLKINFHEAIECFESVIWVE